MICSVELCLFLQGESRFDLFEELEVTMQSLYAHLQQIGLHFEDVI